MTSDELRKLATWFFTNGGVTSGGLRAAADEIDRLTEQADKALALSLQSASFAGRLMDEKAILTVRVAELEKAITEHNVEVFAVCGASDCDAWRDRGLRCTTCPAVYAIPLPGPTVQGEKPQP